MLAVLSRVGALSRLNVEALDTVDAVPEPFQPRDEAGHVDGGRAHVGASATGAKIQMHVADRNVHESLLKA